VSSDAAMAQLAGIMEHAVDSVKIEEHPIGGGGDRPPQVDGGIVTPPNEPSLTADELNDIGMFFSQVDGADDDEPENAAAESETTAAAAEKKDSAETHKEVPEAPTDALAEAMAELKDTPLPAAAKSPAPPAAAAAVAEKNSADMDGANALAALASAVVASESGANKKGPVAIAPKPVTTVALNGPPGEVVKRDANWFDVGIIKGSSCTVSSYYLPSGDIERSEIDVEGDEHLLRKVDLQPGTAYKFR
jgi:hypothetical protein